MTSHLYMHHGRLSPDTGGTDIEGNEVDDWGFTGPDLDGVVGIHTTYGEMRVIFVDEHAANAARAITGWGDGLDANDLYVLFSSDESCLRVFNAARQRDEFFGDWGIAPGPARRYLVDWGVDVGAPRTTLSARSIEEGIEMMQRVFERPTAAPVVPMRGAAWRTE